MASIQRVWRRFEILRTLLGVIRNEANQKAGRATRLAGMLVGSVRRKPVKTVGSGTLAAILLAAGPGSAQGQALKPRVATGVYIPIGNYMLMIVLTVLCLAAGIFIWRCWQLSGSANGRTKGTQTHQAQSEQCIPVTSLGAPELIFWTTVHMCRGVHLDDTPFANIADGTPRIDTKGSIDARAWALARKPQESATLLSWGVAVFQTTFVYSTGSPLAGLK